MKSNTLLGIICFMTGVAIGMLTEQMYQNEHQPPKAEPVTRYETIIKSCDTSNDVKVYEAVGSDGVSAFLLNRTCYGETAIMLDDGSVMRIEFINGAVLIDTGKARIGIK